MTRIISGRFGGRRLITPAGQATRPTSERVREALGNALAAAGGLEGARVLDLYAGSGALGLELASRGAGAVVLVESNGPALAAARANVTALGATGLVTVVPADVAGYAPHPGDRFDIVLADPPYQLPTKELAGVFAALAAAGALGPAADLIVERGVRSGEMTWPDPLVGVRSKRYGDTLLCYGRAP